MSFVDMVKRVLGIGWRTRVRDLETRMARVEGAIYAFDQFARDAEGTKR